jgi:type I restriction enzyme M protein
MAFRPGVVTMVQQNLASEIWDLADLLRGDFRQSEFGRIILPFTLLRRLECVLEPTRADVRDAFDKIQGQGLDPDLILPDIARATFYNTSGYSLATVGATTTRQNIHDYVSKFSENARQVFENFKFEEWLADLEKKKLLFQVTQKFAAINLHPDRVSNHEMGLIFEHLIRKFAESANDTAGEFFTPRDVVRLATTLILDPDHEVLEGEGVVKTIYDCAAGTGGFLSTAIEQVAEWNEHARLIPYGQELNPETYAISVSDKLIQGYDTSKLKLGNTLSDDQLQGERFDYCLTNPPFGVKWEKVQKDVENEHRFRGYEGRFGPGLPRVGDGSLLFLMHLLSKRRRIEEGGTRIGIVLSGSPLFNGGAGSGESEVRRWILENDWLEAIVALPTDMFYNTGIGTYIWILSNRKTPDRKDKVQLIDATGVFDSMQKSLGSKRRMISPNQIDEIARVYAAFEDIDPDKRSEEEKSANPKQAASKIFDTHVFGYRRITVERPLRMRFSVDIDRLALYASTKGADFAERFSSVEGDFISLKAFLKAADVKKLSRAAHKAVLTCFGQRDSKADPVPDTDGALLSDSELRDFENVPLRQDIDEYFAREVKPHVPDAWIDRSKKDEKDGKAGVVGYEVNINRYFYKYVPPRSLETIDADLKTIEAEIAALLTEVTA